jgi:hypothetical protein
MGVFQNNLMGAAAAAASAGGGDFYSHQIANSCRFNRADGSYLSRTIQSGGDLRKWTLSFWFKLTASAGFDGDQYYLMTSKLSSSYDSLIFDVDSDNLFYYQVAGVYLKPNGAFRDTSAWGHLVIVYDSDNGTAADRRIMYLNGTRMSINDSQSLSQNTDSKFNSNSVHYIGARQDNNSSYYGDYYLADVVWSDGYAYAASDFGETKNGVWIPKEFSGSYGTTGYHLKFESSSDLGNDSSGNNNDWTTNNISTHDQLLDSPTFGSSNGGNYCTMNPLNSGSNNTFSEGNLKVTNSSGGCTALGTMSLVTGHKWYFEGKVTGSGNNWIGIIEENGYTNSANTNSSIAGSAGFNNYLYAYNGSIYYGANSSATGATITTGDIIGVLVDLESATNTIQFYKNGAAQGSAFNLTGTGINYTPMSDRGSSTGNGFWFNFGQEGTFGTGSGGGNSDVNGYGDFYYDDGAAAKALCTANLPIAEEIDPAETDDDYPQKLFTALAYSGDNGGSQTTGFQPDLVWVKARSTSQSNGLWDSSRGTTKVLNSNESDAEATSSGLTAFGSTGYTMGTYYNQTGNTYVSWSWRANGGTTSTNSTGSHNATQQVDPSGGFSISTMADTGGNVTVGHGLSKAPSMFIVKGRSGATTWGVYHEAIGATKNLNMNTDGAAGTSSSYFNDTAPTSTVLSLGASWNGAGTLVVYAFANIEGYCKTGSYIGNGNANGSFVYTGFKPKMLFVKLVPSAGNWWVEDTARDTYNPADKYIAWDSDGAEASGIDIDFLSNGFKIRSSSGDFNANGSAIVYGAWAENPFKYATAR